MPLRLANQKTQHAWIVDRNVHSSCPWIWYSSWAHEIEAHLECDFNVIAPRSRNFQVYHLRVCITRAWTPSIGTIVAQLNAVDTLLALNALLTPSCSTWRSFDW